jgi:hypothetical protein
MRSAAAVRPAGPAPETHWVHDFDQEDVVQVAVAYRARFVARKHFGVCFEAGYRALKARRPDMPEDEARRAAFAIISAVTREHVPFFRYEREPGEELWPAGWYVDDVSVDPAEQDRPAAELRELLRARLGRSQGSRGLE